MKNNYRLCAEVQLSLDGTISASSRENVEEALNLLFSGAVTFSPEANDLVYGLGNLQVNVLGADIIGLEGGEDE